MYIVIIIQILTVLFPRFLTRQFKYAVLPSSAVTFLEAARSKYGPVRGVGRGASTVTPGRITLSAAGGDVADIFDGKPLPSSRCADSTETKEKI